mgnify:CR=1 FL=1
MRIEDRNPKGNILDSGYCRVFGDDPGGIRIAELIRKIQSAVIGNGNELEDLIVKHSKHPNTLSNEKLDDFYLGQENAFVVQMALHDVDEGGKNINLDGLLLTPSTVYPLEFKDGMNFDTKKSAGEVSSLNKAAAFVGQRDPLGREVVPKIVLWNCKDISDASFKCKEGEPMLMTGEEFAELASIDKGAIDEERKKDQLSNKQYLLSETHEIRQEEAA